MTHPAGVTHVHYQNETIGPFDLNLIYQRINSGEWSTAQVYHFERGEWLSAQSFMESTTITQFKTEAPISDVAHVHIQGETIGPFSTGQIHMRIISGEWASALIFNAEDGQWLSAQTFSEIFSSNLSTDRTIKANTVAEEAPPVSNGNILIQGTVHFPLDTCSLSGMALAYIKSFFNLFLTPTKGAKQIAHSNSVYRSVCLLLFNLSIPAFVLYLIGMTAVANLRLEFTPVTGALNQIRSNHSEFLNSTSGQIFDFFIKRTLSAKDLYTYDQIQKLPTTALVLINDFFHKCEMAVIKISIMTILIPAIFILIYTIWSGLFMKLVKNIPLSSSLTKSLRLNAYHFGFTHLFIVGLLLFIIPTLTILTPIGFLIFMSIFIVPLVYSIIMLSKTYTTSYTNGFLAATLGGIFTLPTAGWISWNISQIYFN